MNRENKAMPSIRNLIDGRCYWPWPFVPSKKMQDFVANPDTLIQVHFVGIQG
jgi:hypothetical protein